MAEIRCESRKHGEITEQGCGILIIRCNSRFCKVHQNEVVEHHWDLAETNENGLVKLTETKRFKDPTKGNRK